MIEALRLSLDPEGGRPVLLHPGRGEVWWWAGAGPAWTDGARLWVVRDGEAIVLPLPGPVEVEPLPEGGLVAWNEGGQRAFVGPSGPPTLEPPPAAVEVRQGADLLALRQGLDWHAGHGPRRLPLPEGAARARDLRPYRRGEGVCWTSLGWLYRQPRGRAPRPVGAVGAEESFRVGPEGAVLLGGEGTWNRGAAPGRSVRPLPVALLDTPWGLRWSPDGRVVAGMDPDHAATWIDLEEAVVVRTRRRARPLDGLGRWLTAEGTLGPHLEVGGWRPREASWARAGAVLAGPGGVTWNLEVGRRCFEEPAFLLGATVPTPEGWATVDWESGEGAWIEAATGRPGARFRLPLSPGDTVARGWAADGQAWFETTDGHRWQVEGERIALAEVTAPSPPPSATETLPADLPVEGTARVGDRLYGWNTDGLLVAFPA